MKRFNTLKIMTVFGLAVALFIPSISAWASVAGQKVIRMALSTEPPNLNAMKATDQQSFFVLGHVMEGLTRYGKNGAVEPGVAERWKTIPNGMVFYLRKNAKWSDGKTVTAHDFVYGWRTALLPSTASEYAFILYSIKNAEKVNQGKMGPEALGVVAKDDFTLEVTFEKPTPHFLSLSPFATYYPVREDIVKKFGDKYAAEAGNLVYNGPFVLTKWIHGASLKMDKNPTYWNAAKIKIDQIDVPYITADPNARFNFFKDKSTDLLETLAKEDLPKAAKEKYKMQSHSDGSLFFMEFNFLPGKPTRNIHLRKAIQLVFDVNTYVNKVVAIPGTKPGRTLIPTWVRGVKGQFRKEYPIAPVKVDYAKARAEMEIAKKELGGAIPPLVWVTGDSPFSAREAEYFQTVFREKLGIDLKIDKQIFKQRLEKMGKGEFDIVSAGWGPDYPDAMTFADLFTSWNENNRGRYSSPAVDQAIREAQATADPKKRMDAMARAERVVLDELAILPTYERVVIWVQNNRIKNVGRNTFGPDPDFTMAEVIK